jgi:hypothetical protein
MSNPSIPMEILWAHFARHLPVDAVRAVAQSNPTLDLTTGTGINTTIVTGNIDHELRRNLRIDSTPFMRTINITAL